MAGSQGSQPSHELPMQSSRHLSVYSQFTVETRSGQGGQKYVNEWTKEVQETSQTYNQNIPRNTTLEHANTRAEPGIPYECRLPDVHCTS